MVIRHYHLRIAVFTLLAGIIHCLIALPADAAGAPSLEVCKRIPLKHGAQLFACEHDSVFIQEGDRLSLWQLTRAGCTLKAQVPPQHSIRDVIYDGRHFYFLLMGSYFVGEWNDSDLITSGAMKLPFTPQFLLMWGTTTVAVEYGKSSFRLAELGPAGYVELGQWALSAQTADIY